VTYVVIDTGGGLSIRTGPVTIDLVRKEVGVEGWAKVYLDRKCEMVGWVNDCGLLLPEKYPRNPVGACVMATFNAAQNPYAGPVVITGYAYNESGYPEPLQPYQLVGLTDVREAVVRVLAGKEPQPGDGWPSWATPGWAHDIRRFAEHVRTGPTPGWTYR
jgi:hypothetical protein